MKMKKKALAAAITLTLALGAHGNAWADNLYGKVGDVTTDISSAGYTGAKFTVVNGELDFVYGGFSNTSYNSGKNVYDNKVVINSDIGTTVIENSVYGGLSESTGALSNNTVNVSGQNTEIKGSVYGGASENKGNISGTVVSSNANENTVTISDGEILKKVYGGYSSANNTDGSATSGNANKNTVIIIGGQVLSNVYGGYSSATAGSDGTAICGSTNNNTVTISGEDTKIKGNLLGGWSNTGEASGNSVTFKGGTLNCNFLVAGDASTLAKGNTLTIEGGKVYSDYVLASHATTLSESNTLEIKGGTVSAKRISAANTAEVAKDNKVIISGGTVSGNVYAALADNPHWSKLEAENNKMTISGTADVSNAILCGFNISEDFSKGGHDLLLDKYVGKTIYGITNFEKLVFNESYNIQVTDDVDLSKAYQGNSIVDITIADIFGAMGTDTKLNILTANNIQGIAKYNLNGSEIKDGDTVASIDDSGANGVVVTDGSFNAKAQEVSITLNDKFLTGKYIDKAGTPTEKALVLDSGAAAYTNIYGAYDARNQASAAEVTFDNAVDLSGSTIWGNNVSAAGNILNIKVDGIKIGNVKNFEAMSFEEAANAQVAGNIELTNGKVDMNLSGKLATMNLNDKLVVVSAANISGVDQYTLNGSDIQDNEAIVQGAADTNGVKAAKFDFAAGSKEISLTKSEEFLTGKLIDKAGTATEKALVLDSGAAAYTNIYGAYNAKNEATAAEVTFDNAVDLSSSTIWGNNISAAGNILNIKADGIKIGNVKNFEAMSFEEAANAQVAGNIELTNGKVDMNLSGKLATMNLNDKLVVVSAANISGVDQYTLNGSAIQDKDAFVQGASDTNGVKVGKFDFAAGSKEISLTKSEEFLTGKLIDKAGVATEKALKLDSGAAAYTNIYGAYDAKNEASAAEVTFDNAVDLSSSTIWGNNVSAAGNTLNIKAKNVAVGNIKNFETMNFVLPSDTANGDTMLTVNSAPDALDMKAVKNVGVDGSAAIGLHTGDKVDLITDASGISNYSANVNMDSTLLQKYSTVKLEGDVLRLIIDNEKPKDNVAKAPVEAIAASAALVNEGAELAAGGLMLSLGKEAEADGGKLVIFGALGGSKGKYKTGSHVDSNSWNAGLGLGTTIAHAKNSMVMGIFGEYGKSSFDTYNDGLKGSGKASNGGAGVLGRVDNHSGNYYEGSIRAGRATTEWSNAAAGKYDDRATYYGIHAGVGHKFQIGKVQNLDVYGKYFFNHLGSMEGKLKEASYDFGSVNTHMVRVGGRLEYDLNSGAKPYVGLAYEHTFNGDANATMHFGSQSANPGVPSLKGNTGILEAGCRWQGRKVDVAAGVEGYTGVRKGLSGSVNVKWKF